MFCWKYWEFKKSKKGIVTNFSHSFVNISPLATAVALVTTAHHNGCVRTVPFCNRWCPIVADVFQSISYRFIADVNTSINWLLKAQFDNDNRPQSGYLARLIASGVEFWWVSTPVFVYLTDIWMRSRRTPWQRPLGWKLFPSVDHCLLCGSKSSERIHCLRKRHQKTFCTTTATIDVTVALAGASSTTATTTCNSNDDDNNNKKPYHLGL